MTEERRVAIVTGASQGIGAGLVRAYRERGYRVLATARSIGASQDPDVVTIKGDIRLRTTAQSIVNTARRQFGRIDTLVNNAGVYVSKPFTEYTEEDFELVTGVNVAGFFHLTQAVVAEMIARRSGHVVNITAALSDQPRASVPAALVSLTKGGLSAVTRGLAIELARHDVRVNAVAPGVVKTPLHPPESYKSSAERTPLGRIADIREITEAVLFLESAPSITGEVLHVDGGAHAGAP